MIKSVIPWVAYKLPKDFCKPKYLTKDYKKQNK